MTMIDKTPDEAGKRTISGAIAALLTALIAWGLCALALLALSTFLPPWSSSVVLTAVFLGAGVMSFLFCRKPAVRESLEALREGPETKKNGGFWRIFGSVVSLAVASLIIVVGVRMVWHSRAEKLKQELKAQGLPVSLAEFQENLPDDTYAYPKLSQLIEKDFDRAFYEKEFHTGDSIGKWTPETFKKEAPYAAHYAPYLDKLAPLALKKYARYMKVDYAAAAKEPAVIPAPPLTNFMTIARAAKICAVSRAYQGDPAKAWALVRLQFALSDVLAGEKVLISKLVALGLRRVAVETVLDVMLNRPEAAVPADLISRLKEVSSERLVTDALKVEIAYQYDEYAFLARLGGRQFVSSGGLFSAVGPDSVRSGASPGMWVQYEVFALMRLMGMLDINSLETARCFAALTVERPWAQIVEENRKIAVTANSLPSWPYLLVKFALPEFSRMYEREFELKAWTQVALALSELGRARQEKGRYPKDISELKPKAFPAELLNDVFAGGKLLYTPSKDGKGFELCSPGAYGDKKDAFGKELCVRLR